MKVIKINAMWCSGCLVMNKVWKKIISNYVFDVVELDYDMNEDEVKKYNPGNILPVFIFLDENREIGRIVGEKNENEFIRLMVEMGIVNE